MATVRPQKSWRMSCWVGTDNPDDPAVNLFRNPSEARMSVGTGSFVSVQDGRVSISGGVPSKVSIQSFSSNVTYAGLLGAPRWPLTMIPSTVFTPIPQQTFKPPLAEEIPLIAQIANIVTSLV